MKRHLYLLTILLLAGCTKVITVPQKINPMSARSDGSSVTVENIDNYLFRDDCQYIDLRPYSWIAKEGHIAGFSFYPFYDFIASNTQEDRLFSFSKISNEINLGDVGSFTPNYVESEQLINTIFSKEKNIFIISQSGTESIYFINLLVQLNYDCSKLYNIGGFSISNGYESSYIKGDHKYLVKGNGLLESQNVTFDFFKNLTPIGEED